MYFKFWLLSVIVIASFIIQIHSRFEFTNIKCNSLDKNFTDFQYCYIKAVNRTYKYISMRANIFQLPVKTAKVNVALLKRYNGYKPFLYNYTVDACRYLENPGRNPIAKFFGDLYLPFTNINHSCPFNHDIILEKLNIQFANHQMTIVLPFPEGDYCLVFIWSGNDAKRADVRVYMTLS